MRSVINPLETDGFDDKFNKSFVHDSHLKKEFLKHSLQNFYKILKTCFFGTTGMLIILTCLNRQTHTRVLSARKGLNRLTWLQ